MRNRLFIAAIWLIAIVSCTGNARTPKMEETRKLQSPDKRLELTFGLTRTGEPLYALSFDGKSVINESRMGFEIVHEGGINDVQPFMADWTIKESNTILHPSELKKGFSIDTVTYNNVNSSWAPVWGEESIITENYNEMAITLHQKTEDGRERDILIRFRLFNDGLGFRYEFPRQQNLGYFIIGNELTEFSMAEDLTAFWIAGDYDANEFRYETSHLSEIATLYPDFDRSGNSCICPMPVPGVQTPVMMKSDNGGLYVNIHEAALDDFSSMQLEIRDGKRFVAHLVPDVLGNRGYIQTPHHSPWRTVIVTDNAPSILESRLILNLNEPCAIEDTDWIRPQKFVGVWWQMFAPGQGTWSYTDEPNIRLGITDYTKTKPNNTHAANTENVKKYIDFAANNSIEGVLVEGWNEGWEDWFGQFKDFVFDFITPYPDFDVVELREYAKSKGVSLIMHHETSGSTQNYEKYLDRAYQFMKDNNYSVVKSGYVGAILPRGSHHYDQQSVNHYLHCIRRGADYQVMIDAHEPVRPTGMHRTYPNYMAAESGRGTEFESFGPVGNPPEHTTILPFTRFIGGPMDYTPGIFQQKMSYYDGKSQAQIHTTLTKQLALYVVLYSPIQMVADLPENYARFDDAFTFIRNVPTDWDYTKVLEAEPGDYITTARKAKGQDRWFIGAITDENDRTAIIDLSRLPLKDGKEYTAVIYADGADASWDDNPQSYTISTKKVNSKSTLEIHLAKSGGCAIELK